MSHHDMKQQEQEVASHTLTLYQCFLTLPSVRVGKVLAISLQLLPASRSVFSLCSSAGVHGVFVLPFFGTVGLGICCCCCCCCDEPSPTSKSLPTNTPPGTNGFPYPPVLFDEPANDAPPISDARRLRGLVGDCCCWPCCWRCICCCCCC